jgi:hypothetical protein
LARLTCSTTAPIKPWTVSNCCVIGASTAIVSSGEGCFAAAETGACACVTARPVAATPTACREMRSRAAAAACRAAGHCASSAAMAWHVPDDLLVTAAGDAARLAGWMSVRETTSHSWVALMAGW